MVQFVQLQSYKSAFDEAGIAIVAITYDAPDLQQAFIDKNAITYPFLSDIDAVTVKALGILNENYEPGHSNYGIPHPGIFVVDPDLKIVGKMFVEGYKTRVDAQAVLSYAKALL